VSTFGELTAPKVEQTGPSGGDEFVYVDISSIDNQAKRIVDPKRLTLADAPSRARQRLRKGDVLVSMTRPNLNAVAIVPPDLDGAIGSTGFHVLRAKDDVEPHWLYYAVQSSSFVKAMCDLVQGALYPAVRPKDIREYGISPPPLTKQREIVAELERQFSRLDEAVANLQRVKANLKRYKATVLQSAVDGVLIQSTSGFSEVPLQELIGRIAQGWSPKCDLNREALPDEWAIITTTAVQSMQYLDNQGKPLPAELVPRPGIEIAYFSPSWTAFQAERGRDFSVIVDGISN